MESLIWVAGCSIPVIPIAFFLTHFVKPLIIQRMSDTREVRNLRSLTKYYKKHGYDERTAIDMARRDVFAKRFELGLPLRRAALAIRPAPTSSRVKPQSAIAHLLAKLTAWRKR